MWELGDDSLDVSPIIEQDEGPRIIRHKFPRTSFSIKSEGQYSIASDSFDTISYSAWLDAQLIFGFSETFLEFSKTYQFSIRPLGKDKIISSS